MYIYWFSLQTLLPTVDTILYLDTDIVMLGPVERIWNHLQYFNSSHMAALTIETEDTSIGWYNRFAKHPYYGKRGKLWDT